MTIQQYLATLRRGWWWPLAGVLLAGLAAFIYSSRQTPMYQAQATLLLNLADQPNVPTNDNVSASQALTKTYARIITARPTLEEAARRLGDGVTADALGPISGQSAPDTELLTVSFRGPDPAFAAKAVNAVARVFQERVRESQLADGTAPSGDTAAKAAMNTIYIVDPASVPGSPYAPRTRFYTIVASILGLLAGLGIPIVLDYFNDKITSRDDVEAAGLALMGVVPRVRAKGKRLNVLKPAYAGGFFAEGYHQLRANTQFAAHENDIRSLIITSPTPRDGKTTVASNLAILFANVGRRVILVDADLRRPNVHSFFGLPNKVGLTTALADQNADLRTLLQRTPLQNLSVLSAGPHVAKPVEMLSSSRLSMIVSELSLMADLVIWDSAPAVALADAPIIAQHMDAVLMVIHAGRTQARVLRVALDNIDWSHTTLLGGVLNGVTRETGTGYDYYYKYTGRSGYILREPWMTAEQTEDTLSITASRER